MKKEWTGERLETGINSQVTAEHLHRYALAMEFVQGKTVLDIACGEGYGSNLMAEKAASVIGVDIDKSVVNDAKNKYRKSNLSFFEGTAIIEDHSIDIVVSFETLEHTSDHEAFLAEIKRVLKHDGLLIISTPDKKWYTDKTGYVNPFHQKELYAEEFETLLKNSFSHVKIVVQKFVSGSMIFSSDEKSATDFYAGSFDSIDKHEPEAPYMIAVASDGALPEISNSFFSANNIMDAAVQQKEMDIKNSMSYKLGNFILSPAKWLKKLFQKA